MVEATMRASCIGREKVRAICQQANIPIPGREIPVNNASPETVRYIQGYKSDYQGVGYQRVAGVAKRKGFPATEWSVRKVFGEHNLFSHCKLPKNPN